MQRRHHVATILHITHVRPGNHRSRCGIPYRVRVINPARQTPATTQHRWPDTTDGPWLVTLTWQEIDGRPECVGLTITGAENSILTAGVMRKLPVADWIAEDRADMTPRAAATVGLRTSTVERLKTAADIYQQARREGRPPTKAVAEHYGISHGGASHLVSRARNAGLLPPTSRGVSTG